MNGSTCTSYFEREKNHPTSETLHLPLAEPEKKTQVHLPITIDPSIILRLASNLRNMGQRGVLVILLFWLACFQIKRDPTCALIPFLSFQPIPFDPITPHGLKNEKLGPSLKSELPFDPLFYQRTLFVGSTPPRFLFDLPLDKGLSLSHGSRIGSNKLNPADCRVFGFKTNYQGIFGLKNVKSKVKKNF